MTGKGTKLDANGSGIERYTCDASGKEGSVL
jgi:hypothetical protein